ncbi:ribosome-associated protein [Shewanella sp. JM162201]|uniref:Dual-action ribosomal maturation protein DarP n=1 Tax=Shewanella jiangmenensis TaxID=2837387 RepID=A0ABS5V0I5_9GAMM|nr:ribosome biogenesis factor YjgA [Shewanella jiangmenensis]MBT1443984.1 ribosome-associated protein [Shewanella jiangmenensis]
MNVVGDPENFKQPYDDDENYVSKSSVKRESHAAQELGKRLLSLSSSQLGKLELDEILLEALTAAKKIKANSEAHRRQLQYIGKLMRNIETEPVLAALDKLANRNNSEAARVHVLEKTRDRLLSEGDSEIQQLVEAHPALDRQKLRQLVRALAKEVATEAAKEESNPAKALESKPGKELLKYLRDGMAS